MSDDGTTDVGTDNATDYRHVRLPEGLARRTQALWDLPEPPATMGELLDRVGRVDGFIPDGADWRDLLVSDEATLHEVRVDGETLHTYCVLDALELPFVLDRPVVIRSRVPGRGETVRMTADPGGVRASDDGVIISFGAATALPEDPDTLDRHDAAGLQELTHNEACPTINAFPDRRAYEEWAADSAVVSVALTLPQAWALVRDAAEQLAL